MRFLRFLPIIASTVLAATPAFANPPPAPVDPSATVAAVPAGDEREMVFDGVVEAVRAAVVAAQVPGTIVGLDVEEGDRVEAGSILLRVDARIADRQAAANEARLASARADLAAATRDVERQRRLHRENFISAAAIEQAEAGFAAARARVDALVAETTAAQVQSGLHVLRAPFTGVVSDVPVSAGDMAMPGRALLDLYDPAALRVAVMVPQSVAARLDEALALHVELPGASTASMAVAPADVQPQPVVDAATHTARLRIALPAVDTAAVAPGMFARLRIVLPADRDVPGLATPVSVPAGAIVRRAELTGLYVLEGSGRPVLRQVRLGRRAGDRIEILTGLAAGERVFVDPIAAGRLRQPLP